MGNQEGAPSARDGWRVFSMLAHYDEPVTLEEALRLGRMGKSSIVLPEHAKRIVEELNATKKEGEVGCRVPGGVS